MRIFCGVMFALGMTGALMLPAGAGEVLYNGIQLPDVWPPADRTPTREPMEVPYLQNPPEVIPIDVGRQLFVDDFLIAETTLKRTLYPAEYYPNNPVLGPDKPWETVVKEGQTPSPTAMPFSDGVWYDPQDKLFKMWYMGGYVKATCYAVSKDGIHWEKPDLDVVPGTNVVQAVERDSNTVWLDLEEKDPARRYKMFVYKHPGPHAMSVFFSADGIHWGDEAAVSGRCGDRTSAFYNPFRQKWVISVRDYDSKGIGRFRRYSENADVLKAIVWEESKSPFWIGADTLDPARADLSTPCELYNLDVAAYESLMIGLFSIWRGQPKDRAKPNELCIGFTRDGFHWSRPTHEPFIPVSETYGDWNWANIQSAGGCCLVVDDKLYFYVSARKGVKGETTSGVCSTGLAMSRRDGFASMDADSSAGALTTRPIIFKGKHLFVNADASKGEVRVEVLDKEGNMLPGYTAEACTPLKADTTRSKVTWNGKADLGELAGKPVRFRFHVRNAKLYSFWVTPSESGASHGYVAAGGPGFDGPLDDK